MMALEIAIDEMSEKLGLDPIEFRILNDTQIDPEKRKRPFSQRHLAECLRTGALSIVTWVGIGRCIRRFHDLGVCHADLNAHNILLSEEAVYLIDFDRCQLRKAGLWRDRNLVRLRRSLEKIAYGLPAERFTEADWHALLDGYRRPAADRPEAAADQIRPSA